MPSVSVIIPVYNGEAFLEEAIESVYGQTFTDWELIVIDDGSTDGTEAVLQRHAKRIRSARQENCGQNAARRRAVELARGPLIAFLDADDIWLPRKLEVQVHAAREHPECGIITTDALKFSDAGDPVPTLKQWYRPASGDALESLLHGNWIPPSAAMVPRKYLRYVTTFDVPPPCYGEDWLMWMQIAARAPVHFIDAVLVRRRVHPGAASSHSADLQFRCLMRNFEIVRERIPRLNGFPSPVDAAIFEVSLRRGIRDFTAGRLPEAREKLSIAAAKRPEAFQPRLLLLILRCVPWGLLLAARRLLRKLKPRRAEGPLRLTGKTEPP